jgi:hypothetical protein
MPSRLHHLLSLNPRYAFAHRYLKHFHEPKKHASVSKHHVPEHLTHETEGEGAHHKRRSKPLKFLL